MRNFRTTAVASATALTVLVGGTAIASAAPQDNQAEKTNSSSDNGSSSKAAGEENKNAKADRAVIFTDKQTDGVKANGETQADKDFGQVVSDGTKGLFGGQGSSQYVTKEDAATPFYPTDAFGNKTNPELVPQWARYWIDGTVIAGIGALVGLVIAGVNFASYNGWIQLPQF